MRILMVCLGNICRSPLADGVLRHKIASNNIQNVVVDSAGTSGYHNGQSPDERMIKTAKSKGIDISYLTSRKFETYDFDEFDIIYVMDDANYVDVTNMASSEEEASKVRYLLSEIDGVNNPVLDPYYGGEKGFLHVFDLVDKATDRIIDKIVHQKQL